MQCKDTMKEYYDRVMGIFDELANTSLEDRYGLVTIYIILTPSA
jgi:hypothetical protein